MTTAQILFSIALGLITIVITVFAVFVVSTTMGRNRWIRKPGGAQGKGNDRK